MPLQTGFRPDMLVENHNTKNFKDGKLVWELKAKKASYYYNEKKSIAENIILHYFKDDKLSAIVKADSAVLFTESKDIDLDGNVDMISTTGNRLLTTRIRWNNKDGYLDTNEYVQILRKNGDRIEGTGLRADYNLEGYEIKKKVKAVSKNMSEPVKRKKNEKDKKHFNKNK
ncbi:MAG: LPS export ABC transporter periplasmic protein LptC [Spirochaetes bacterium]|nr:LPS export ABC transporter periplasmic protein LptC [Spirochaetota bacterium]